jgi:WD40 repeat protein
MEKVLQESRHRQLSSTAELTRGISSAQTARGLAGGIAPLLTNGGEDGAGTNNPDWCLYSLDMQPIKQYSALFQARRITCMRFVPTGDKQPLLATAWSHSESDNRMRVHRRRYLIALWRYHELAERIMLCESAVTSLAFGAEYQRQSSLVVAGTEDGSVVMWDWDELPDTDCERWAQIQEANGVVRSMRFLLPCYSTGAVMPSIAPTKYSASNNSPSKQQRQKQQVPEQQDEQQIIRKSDFAIRHEDRVCQVRFIPIGSGGLSQKNRYLQLASLDESGLLITWVRRRFYASL